MLLSLLVIFKAFNISKYRFHMRGLKHFSFMLICIYERKASLNLNVCGFQLTDGHAGKWIYSHSPTFVFFVFHLNLDSAFFHSLAFPILTLPPCMGKCRLCLWVVYLSYWRKNSFMIYCFWNYCFLPWAVFLQGKAGYKLFWQLLLNSRNILGMAINGNENSSLVLCINAC